MKTKNIVFSGILLLLISLNVSAFQVPWDKLNEYKNYLSVNETTMSYMIIAIMAMLIIWLGMFSMIFLMGWLGRGTITYLIFFVPIIILVVGGMLLLASGK